LTTAPPGEVLGGAQLSPPCLPLVGLTRRRAFRLAEPGAKARLGGQPAAFHWMIAVNQVASPRRLCAPTSQMPVSSFDHLGRTGEQCRGAARPHLFNH